MGKKKGKGGGGGGTGGASTSGGTKPVQTQSPAHQTAPDADEGWQTKSNKKGTRDQQGQGNQGQAGGQGRGNQGQAGGQGRGNQGQAGGQGRGNQGQAGGQGRGNQGQAGGQGQGNQGQTWGQGQGNQGQTWGQGQGNQGQTWGQGQGNQGQAGGQGRGNQGQAGGQGQGNQGQTWGQGQGNQGQTWGQGQGNQGQAGGQGPGNQGRAVGQGPGNQGQAWGRGQGQGRGRGQPGQDRGSGAPGLQTPGQHQGPPGGSAWGPPAYHQSPTAAPIQPQTVVPIQTPTAALSQLSLASEPQKNIQSSAKAPSASSGDSRSAVSERAVALPLRAKCPPAPKVGAPIQLEVNHLLVQIKDPTLLICHYDVSIDPDKPKRFMRPVMDAVQRKCYPRNYPGFDGRKNLYSKGLLPFGEHVNVEVQVVDDERVDKALKSFKVNIKVARKGIALADLFAYQKNGRSNNVPQDVIQAIDVILRTASARKFISVGRSFFCPQKDPVDLGSGLELWLGFFQSFIMGTKPFLNIDVAHKGFPKKQHLLNLLSDLDRQARSPDEAMERRGQAFEQFVKTLKITYAIPGIESSQRTYRVNGLRKSAMLERFQTSDGKEMTVGEYFHKEKKIQLKYPHLPCLHVGPREKDILLPIEFCSLVGGQAVQRKLDEFQTSQMIKVAATNVTERKRKIKEAMNRANLNASAEVKEFGLSVADEFANVNGRILPPPKLEYKSQVVTPMKGVWRGGRFLQTRHLQTWVVIVLCNVHRDDLNSFINNLIHEGKNLDMKMEPPKQITSLSPFKVRNELMPVFKDLQRKGVQLALIVIPGNNKQIYGQVKQLAEIQAGILTQCVKEVTVTRRNNQATVHNIMLKINAKCNGTNQVIAQPSQLKIFQNKVLVIGADVTHPSPDSRDIPSVAAVTASHDPTGFKYNMQIRLQPPKQEIISDLENILFDQLSRYKKETNALPQHILYYRDGVSDGQFQKVLDEELPAIHRACQKHGVRPKVTLLVVQKRHHTRFFPKDPRSSNDRNGNVPAGTIVDSEICHPTEIDFYLVSHASIQGVARPTKYHVLWDDSNMSENDIQLLTYNLCHLFTRCDRTVSYPAPTYYAHLAASRGRVYLEGRSTNLENLKKESERIQTAVDFTKNSPMYFV